MRHSSCNPDSMCTTPSAHICKTDKFKGSQFQFWPLRLGSDHISSNGCGYCRNKLFDSSYSSKDWCDNEGLVRCETCVKLGTAFVKGQKFWGLPNRIGSYGCKHVGQTHTYVQNYNLSGLEDTHNRKYVKERPILCAYLVGLCAYLLLSYLYAVCR